MTTPFRRLRLFLDAGVIIGGCRNELSASRGVLVLAAQTPNFTVVLAEAIDQEVRRSINRVVAARDPATASRVLQTFQEWRGQVHLEWHASPTEAELVAHRATVLPVLRHVNDLTPVVTAMRAQPDWVISSNTEHWHPALAARTGLRITTPWDFLNRFYPA